MEAFNEPVVLTDEKAAILDMNSAAQELFGWRVEEVIGKPVNIFMPQSVAMAHARYVDKYNSTGEKRLIGKPRKMKAITKSGREFNMILSLGEINNDGPKKYIATIKDLSQDEIMSEKLNQEIDHQVNEVSVILKERLHNLAHDLMKSDESLKTKVEELKNQNKELKTQLHDISSQLQLEKSTHAIVSNALYSVLRAGLHNKQDTTTPSAIINKLVDEQIQESSNQNTLFREDCENTRKIIAFLAFEGAPYLVYTLERPLQKLLASTRKRKELNAKRLIKYSNLILEAITHSDNMVPE